MKTLVVITQICQLQQIISKTIQKQKITKIQKMTTQITKLNTLKSNLKQTFKQLYSRLSNTNSEITIIVKKSDEPDISKFSCNNNEKQNRMFDGKPDGKQDEKCQGYRLVAESVTNIVEVQKIGATHLASQGVKEQGDLQTSQLDIDSNLQGSSCDNSYIAHNQNSRIQKQSTLSIQLKQPAQPKPLVTNSTPPQLPAYNPCHKHKTNKINNRNIAKNIGRQPQQVDAVNQKQNINKLINNLELGIENSAQLDSFNIFISTKEILPNVQITSRVREKQREYRGSRNKEKDNSKDKYKQHNPNSVKNSTFKSQTKSSNRNTNKNQEMTLPNKNKTNIKAQQENEIKQKNKEQLQQKNLQGPGFQPIILQNLSKKNGWVEVEQNPPAVQVKVNMESNQDQALQGEQVQGSTTSTDPQSFAQSLFLIQDKLNDAISLITQNKIFQLEQYLYQFKTRYTYISDRIQIKWRLLMAYCKESRKEYQRASILYQQVLDMGEAKPKALFVEPAEIYHRLGICYMEIRKWNEGIMEFGRALEEFKTQDKKIKYAQCMNNLGTLYLQACQLEQAQKCFLHSYKIKKSEYPKRSRKLISTLFNLYQCNLAQHNYQQAQYILKQIQNMLNGTKDADMLMAALYRRRGKLSFLRGDVGGAEGFYSRALGVLVEQYPYSLQYGQLCNNLAIVKLQQQSYQQSKHLFNIAMSRLNFYYTKDSDPIKKIKNNIQLVNRAAIRSRSSKLITTRMVQPEAVFGYKPTEGSKADAEHGRIEGFGSPRGGVMDGVIQKQNYSQY